MDTTPKKFASPTTVNAGMHNVVKIDVMLDNANLDKYRTVDIIITDTHGGTYKINCFAYDATEPIEFTYNA